MVCLDVEGIVAAKAELLMRNLFTSLHREPWFRDDNPEKLYLKAEKPGARVTVEIETRKGTIKIYHLKSKWYGLGSVSCWTDDDTSRAVRADGWWDHGDLNIGRRVCYTNREPGERTNPVG
jgi:hypothetical protein